ncbi:protein MOR1-like [Humulus lupulus]|uniref:protein MOR1-like n=1 Tax=Humulus lupulus TaxID=3486 RepID=UPI002B403304|nr:protein MOR1-like [Humulus lupulus]
MKCLTTFCEAVGPGFIFERLYKILKEHKNPKVLSEGLLWMVSAVKLKDLIDFCKDTGLQSSAAATRNSSVKLLGVLHKFTPSHPFSFVDIKGFLSDVKPALLSALDTEYGKNPFEGAAAAPKRTIKSAEPTLLKGLESTDWKARLESIEAVNKVLEEANKRVQPNGTTEFFGALRGRLGDSNKNLVMATLTCIGNVACAMSPAVEKASKGILADVLKCLGDNKKHMRECTFNTLDSWLSAVHLDKMVPYIAAAWTDAKLGAEGHKDLFEWLSKQLSLLIEFPDAVQLLKPASSSLTDKSSDVRKAAETCIAEILRVCTQETVEKLVRDVQGPALALVRDNDLMKYFREDLHRRLLSIDFKKQIDGLEMLQKEIVEVLDIPLRWFVLQFYKSNTTCLLKVLEFLPELLDTLRNEGHSLTESEAAIFLPCLIEKMGHNIEKLWEKIRELTKKIVQTYSAVKSFPYILEGLRSKNNRTRIECADLVGYIVDNHGAEISGYLKSLQIVACLTAERDGEIRKATLNTLATGYKILGMS